MSENVVMSENVDLVRDVLLIVSHAMCVCELFLVSVCCLLPCFSRGGKLSFLAQVLSTVASPSCYLRLHKACSVLVQSLAGAPGPFFVQGTVKCYIK